MEGSTNLERVHNLDLIIIIIIIIIMYCLLAELPGVARDSIRN
jgi:hypothetical protein